MYKRIDFGGKIIYFKFPTWYKIKYYLALSAGYQNNPFLLEV